MRPATRPIKRITQPIPLNSSRQFEFSWPAIVEGPGWTYEPYDSLEAQQRARGQLHRLCALLTVLFDGLPWLLEWSPETAPPSPYSLDMRDGLFEDSGPNIPFDRSPVEVPAWLGTAWDAIASNRPLEQALDLYYEGAQIKDAHPSMALLAFVGTIESLARAGRERCSCCSQYLGSTRRFKDALAEVLTPREAVELGSLYEMRSKTAHAGTLFGFEATFNVIGHPRFIPPDGQFEALRLTTEAKRAAGLLLVRRFNEAAETDTASHQRS